MPKFIVKETMACYVTWDYVVEAEDADEALTKYYDGDHNGTVGEPYIGDGIDFLETDEEVFPACTCNDGGSAGCPIHDEAAKAA